jgi:protein-tyrosine phosphatase
MEHRVLVVCTANVCRSPMAATMLETACRAQGTDVHVTSAGVTAVTIGVDPVAVRLMAERGFDIAGHVPHQVTPAELVEADLVVAMTRSHVRTLVADHRSPLSRTFTLKELARRLDDQLVMSLEELQVGRSRRDLLGRSADDDIADPYGGPADGYATCIADLERSVGALVAGLGRGLLSPSDR